MVGVFNVGRIRESWRRGRGGRDSIAGVIGIRRISISVGDIRLMIQRIAGRRRIERARVFRQREHSAGQSSQRCDSDSRGEAG